MKRFSNVAVISVFSLSFLIFIFILKADKKTVASYKARSSQKNQLAIGSPVEAEAAKKWVNRVYLATYPRSGNHWMRYLIEEATGVATSSSYMDPDPKHLETFFPWGGFCCDHGYEGRARYPAEGEIAVVKTHFPAMHTSWFDQLPYRAAIRIIRHPVDSFYSLYLWEQKHKGEIAMEHIPKKTLKNYIRSWQRFQNYWNSAENVITLRYEDLFQDASGCLSLVFEKVGFQIEPEALERALARHPPEGKPLKYLDHFSPEELSMIQNKLRELMKKYGYEIDKINPFPQHSFRSKEKKTGKEL